MNPEKGVLTPWTAGFRRCNATEPNSNATRSIQSGTVRIVPAEQVPEGEFLSSAVAPPEPGGRNSPERQLTASVFTGSTATATLSVRPQGQSKLIDQRR